LAQQVRLRVGLGALKSQRPRYSAVMGAQSSCCTCEDEEATDFVEDDRKLGREKRKKSANEFTVIIDRRSGDGLGIDAAPDPNGTLVIKNITKGGLVDNWNESLPPGSREIVRQGMRVIEVNGRYSSVNAIITACRETEVLHITLTPNPA